MDPVAFAMAKHDWIVAALGHKLGNHRIVRVREERDMAQVPDVPAMRPGHCRGPGTVIANGLGRVQTSHLR
jgi:hypothetical protein